MAQLDDGDGDEDRFPTTSSPSGACPVQAAKDNAERIIAVRVAAASMGELL
jgi:hypothetical protein